MMFASIAVGDYFIISISVVVLNQEEIFCRKVCGVFRSNIPVRLVLSFRIYFSRPLKKGSLFKKSEFSISLKKFHAQEKGIKFAELAAYNRFEKIFAQYMCKYCFKQYYHYLTR